MTRSNRAKRAVVVPVLGALTWKGAGRLDLSVEALVTDPSQPFHHLFSSRRWQLPGAPQGARVGALLGREMAADDVASPVGTRRPCSAEGGR